MLRFASSSVAAGEPARLRGAGQRGAAPKGEANGRGARPWQPPPAQDHGPGHARRRRAAEGRSTARRGCDRQLDRAGPLSFSSSRSGRQLGAERRGSPASRGGPAGGAAARRNCPVVGMQAGRFAAARTAPRVICGLRGSPRCTRVSLRAARAACWLPAPSRSCQQLYLSMYHFIFPPSSHVDLRTFVFRFHGAFV